MNYVYKQVFGFLLLPPDLSAVLPDKSDNADNLAMLTPFGNLTLEGSDRPFTPHSKNFDKIPLLFRKEQHKRFLGVWAVKSALLSQAQK